MGGRGPASIGLNGISAASALLCSRITKPHRHLRWADATLQHYQPCSPLPRANISPLCKSTKTCHLTGGSNATPRSIHHNQHITLRSTKHSLCSSWVRCYILPWCASFQTSPGAFSVIIFKTDDLAPTLQIQRACTYTTRWMTTPKITQPTMPDALVNKSISPIQLPTCQQGASANLPQVYSITPFPPIHQPEPTGTTSIQTPTNAKNHHHHTQHIVPLSPSPQNLLPPRPPKKTFQHGIASDESRLHSPVQTLIYRVACVFWAPETGTTYHALAKPQTIRNFKAGHFYMSAGARTSFFCDGSGYRMGSPHSTPTTQLPRAEVKKAPETGATQGVDTDQWASPLMPICVNACPVAQLLFSRP